MDKIKKLYQLEVTEIIKKLKEKAVQLIEVAKQSGLSASKEKEQIAGVTTVLNGQLATLNAVAKAKGAAGVDIKTGSQMYKKVDKNGKTIGLTNVNQLTDEEKKAGVTLVVMHEGGKVKTKIPGGEGIAILKDEEIVSTPKQEAQKGNQIYLTIQEGAFKITANKLDEGTIRNAGKLLFEEIYSQLRAHNISFAKG